MTDDEKLMEAELKHNEGLIERRVKELLYEYDNLEEKSIIYTRLQLIYKILAADKTELQILKGYIDNE